MYVFTESIRELEGWIQKEVAFERDLSEGDHGPEVRRVQEWLNLNGNGVVIDGGYGPVTAEAVANFQDAAGLEASGTVDEETSSKLVEPMTSILVQRLQASYDLNTAILEYARAHLEKHPVEIGGANKGPWVRLYMEGRDGAGWPWCAGFVTFVLYQAVQSLNVDMPLQGSFSCDVLAAQAKDADLFLPEADALPESIAAGSIFLVRRTDTDWNHAGFVTAARNAAFDTIEGNTNDDGSPDGYEVTSRSRGYAAKDFICFSQPTS